MSSNSSGQGRPSDSIAWNRDMLPPGPEQDAVIRGVTGEITEKGFVVAILFVNVPATIITSDCRGDPRGMIPMRSRS